MKRLFHLVPTPAWDAHRAAGTDPWTAPGFAKEGFLHLSFADQLQGTLEVHFAGVDGVTLLEVNPQAVAADLRLEPSRAGALFPHLYRPLRADDLLRRFDLVRGSEGLRAPTFGDDPSGDSPRGHSAP